MKTKTTVASGRIRGLDGLRALAIIFVMAYHIFPKAVPGGYIGVDLFFVISGFLITTLIASEYMQRGALNLRAFWVRRARRLIPALTLTVGIVCTVALFIGSDILVGIGRQIIGALTFSSNWLEIAAGANYFDATTPHIFTNFWSLAVEEQFYITWPIIVVLILSIRRRSLQVAMIFCSLMAVASACLMAFIYAKTGDATRVYYGLDTHMFGLMMGAAFAFYRLDRVNKKGTQIVLTAGKRRLDTALVTTAIFALTALALVLPDGSAFAYEGGIVIASLLSLLLITSLLYMPTIWRRWLELRPIRWIGVRSYGIYLWHWPIIVMLHEEYPTMNSAVFAGLTVMTSGVMAALSYRFVETPIRRRGIRQFLKNGIMREVTAIDGATTRWKLRPHPLLPFALLILIATVGAVVTAPTVTRAEQQIQAGQEAIKIAQQKAKQAALAVKPRVITGSDMTLVGDSVALASAPALEQRFPGIFIDAKVSRSLRGGGFDVIQQYIAAGTLRQVVVIALGTNGYYGTGNLAALMTELGPHRDVIFVTSHAPVPWIDNNNADLVQLQHQYKNVYLSQWDAAITPHPELLAPDGIHPGMAGGELYADALATALSQIKS